MVRRTLKRGKGAICSILLAHIHPSLHIRQKYPNRTRQDRLEGYKILRQARRKIDLAKANAGSRVSIRVISGRQALLRYTVRQSN